MKKESIHFKPTFDVCNISRGKFDLKKYISSNSKCPKYSDSEVGSPRKTFSGEKFNGISVVSTPTKRKFDSFSFSSAKTF